MTAQVLKDFGDAIVKAIRADVRGVRRTQPEQQSSCRLQRLRISPALSFRWMAVSLPPDE